VAKIRVKTTIHIHSRKINSYAAFFFTAAWIAAASAIIIPAAAQKKQWP